MSVFVWSVVLLVVLVAAVWMAGAIYYDVGGAGLRGRVLAVAWLVVVSAAFVVWRPVWEPVIGFGIVFAAFCVWWGQIPAMQDRDWRPELARPPSARIDGDRVVLRDVRHTRYRSVDDVDARWEDREVRLSGLRGVDLLISNWGSSLMCHPFAIFEFAPPPGEREPVRVAFSVEVRSMRGQGFSLTRNLYKQNELICVMADERDLMRRRVEHEEGRTLFLYRLKIRSQTVRARFLEYVELMNELAARPAWYHALTTNCTTGIFRRYGPNRLPLDWRVLVNGRMDRWLYGLGVLETGGLGFEELRERSMINDRVWDAAGVDDGPTFSAMVRRGVPGFGGASPSGR